ncbi:hypothetical protein [Spirillospora sp. CA-294931]|uniref:hypothetical protein n=1 Tax=Spirillospora sp. CA-294931 TaxID=3240042 RepID=UPI003D929ED5
MTDEDTPSRTDRPARDQGTRIFITATILGVILVAVGWIIDGANYIPGLLLEAGTTLMLLVPVVVLGLAIESRVRRTEQRILETAARLDALSAATRERMIEHHRHREELFGHAARAPDRQLIQTLLSDALQIQAISEIGVRVQIPHTPVRARFLPCSPNQAELRIRIEEPEGAELAELGWAATEPADVFSHRLADQLRSCQNYPGEAAFDPSVIFMRLINTLHTAVTSRTGDRPHDLGPLIEIPNTQWAISAEGLFCLDRPYFISCQQLYSNQDWPTYLGSQSWVNEAQLSEAYYLARHLLRNEY